MAYARNHVHYDHNDVLYTVRSYVSKHADYNKRVNDIF